MTQPTRNRKDPANCTVQTRVPASVLNWLKDLAARRGVTVSELAREILKKYRRITEDRD